MVEKYFMCENTSYVNLRHNFLLKITDFWGLLPSDCDYGNLFLSNNNY